MYALLAETPGDTVAAGDHVRALPATLAIAVARAVAWDRDAVVGYLGTSVLIERGCVDAAVPPLGEMIADGRVETELHGRLGYDWVHADDDGLYPRMAARIGRYLVARRGVYDDASRARVDAFVMGGRAPFSAEAAARRLDELERAGRTK